MKDRTTLVNAATGILERHGVRQIKEVSHAPAGWGVWRVKIEAWELGLVAAETKVIFRAGIRALVDIFTDGPKEYVVRTVEQVREVSDREKK